MAYRDLKKAIEIIENKISTLPRGYISEKNILGRTYYYQQWHEGGKTRSKYIKRADVEWLGLGILERKRLESRLKKLKSELPAGPGEQQTFHTNVLLGTKLLDWAVPAEGLQKRDCYDELQAYLQGDERSRVCLIYGLRRTGKTTLLQQAILELPIEELSKTALIQATQTDSFDALNQDIKKLSYLGYKIVLIDEATLMPDFVNSAALLPDIYAAQGMKIVLSGTDSLGFWFAKNDSLYDRTRMIHTTFIPFREHQRLIGISDVDSYIQYGGTLEAGKRHIEGANLFVDTSFENAENAQQYIKTAVCTNIERSLAYYEDGKYFRNLKTLYDAGELTNVIARHIQKMNHKFAIEIVQEDFSARDYGSANQLLQHSKDPERKTDILNHMDKDEIVRALKEKLAVKDAEDLRVGVTEAHLTEIKQYLSALELIEELPLYSNAAARKAGQYGELIYFTQPGMRYAQTEELIRLLKKDTIFDGLSEKEKDNICDTILNDVRGRMLEEIVLIETLRSCDNTKEVFQYTLPNGEYDMVIYDKAQNTCEAYEVKHSKRVNSEQIKHLINEEYISGLEKQFGTVAKRCVIYRGEEFVDENGIVYLNASKYLSELKSPTKDWVQVSRERFAKVNSLISDATVRFGKSEPNLEGGTAQKSLPEGPKK